MISENELTRELSKAIQKAAIDGTLSEGACRQFEDTLVANRELSEQLTKSEEQRNEGEKVLRLVQQERDDARKVRDVLLAKEQDMNDRIAQDEVLQVTVKYEQKRVEDHKSMVGLIFRNTLLKSQAATPGHPGAVDQYGNRVGEEYSTVHNLEKEET